MMVLHSGAIAAHPDMVTGVCPDTKAELRLTLLAARRELSLAIRLAESEALAEHLNRSIALADATVCAYLPVGNEPGSTTLVETLRQLCKRVLLPATRTDARGTPLPLEWGEYEPETLITGRYGLLEPGEPRLPAAAIAEASIIVVPALAVDRRGVRLGRGGGYYDRSLPLRSAGCTLIAVVRDDELVNELPAETHDVRMTHVLTPGHGLIALANPE